MIFLDNISSEIISVQPEMQRRNNPYYRFQWDYGSTSSHDEIIKCCFSACAHACQLLQLCLTVCDLMRLWLTRFLRPWDFPGKNTGVSSHALLQGIFPTQCLNSGLQHCKWILYLLSHKGSSRILERVAYPFSRGSSQARNRTGVSCKETSSRVS